MGVEEEVPDRRTRATEETFSSAVGLLLTTPVIDGGCGGIRHVHAVRQHMWLGWRLRPTRCGHEIIS